MTCEPFEVVVVPFPFVDRPSSKRRPALVLSRAGFNASGHSILAMVTTRARPAWPGDVAISDRASAGLPQDCLVRLKLFTLDNRLIADRLGRLGEDDRAEVTVALEAVLAG